MIPYLYIMFFFISPLHDLKPMLFQIDFFLHVLPDQLIYGYLNITSLRLFTYINPRLVACNNYLEVILL